MQPITTDLGTLGPGCAGVQLSVEEFLTHDAWEKGPRSELVNGVLVVSPFASEGVRYPTDELGHWLHKYQEEHPAGNYLDATVYGQEIVTARI